MTVAAHSEATEVDALEKNASWTVGSSGYLLSTAWWNTWVQYSNYTGPGASSTASLLQLPGGSGPRPGPISNADLLPSVNSAAKSHLSDATTSERQPASDPEAVPLRLGLVEQRDFVVVSAATWKHLHSTYGGGPSIARRVVAEAAPRTSGRKGVAERWGRLALYPLRLEVLYKPKNGTERSSVVSVDPEASVSVLKARACAALGVAESEVTLWDYTGGKPVRSLEAAPPRVVGGTALMAVEDGTPAAPLATTDGAANRSGRGGSGVSMEIDSAAVPVKASARDDVMCRTLREVPLLDQQLLGLRKTDAGITSFDADDEGGEDACGSDNDNDTGTESGRKEAGRKATGRMSIAEEAAAAALRRASAAGSARSDGGSGTGVTAPPATARTSGGGTVPMFGSNRQRPSLGTLEDNVIQRDGQIPGLAGLSNLGNTCFMNSSLQCLAHAIPLITAFLGGAYLQDLNRTNPLGMKGELAEAFGALMELLWRGGLSAVTPRSFKAKIGRFAPQFSGYAQHDSQEFLAFLLDGLHEDMNRIKNKPYIEEKDQPGRPDEIVATEAWANYRARNDSLVVDHFQGLFKSTVDCPQCGFNSVKFDPFMYLSLPLPESRRRVVEVILVRMDGSELPCRMALELASGATLADLLRATAHAGRLPAAVVSSPDTHLLAARPLRPPSANNDELVLLTDTRMRVADALDGGGVSNYSLRSSANNSDSGLVVYYYPDAARGPRAEGLGPVIVHFKRPDSRRTASWNRGVWCGAPLVLYMPEDQPPYDPEQVAKVSNGPGNRSEWEISGDCSLAAALVEVLRPIQRLPLASAQPPTPESASLPEGVASPGPHEQARVPPVALAVVSAEEQPVADEVAAPHSRVLDSVAIAGQHGGVEQRSAAAQMEEDERPLSACVVDAAAPAIDATFGRDGELRPGTPTWEGDRGVASTSVGVAKPLRHCSSGGGGGGGDKASATGDLMEGVESPPVPVPAVDAVPTCGFASGLPGGHGDASMPGTPEHASYGPMEDDVGAAGPASLPPVIIAGPPESAYAEDAEGLGPSIQPFDMWAAQSTWGPEDVADAAGAAVAGPSSTSSAAATASAVPFSGSPFSLKLCTSKGESSLWGGIYDKDIKVEHHREFLLMFNDSCAGGSGASPPVSISGGDAAATAATSLGPYAAELLDSPTEHPSLGEHRRRAAAGPHPVSLDACMTTFLQPERLAESDAWYCPRCKSHVCADKKLDLWSLPEVLVVHLKRFSYTRYSRNKLDTRVDFPLHGLDLGPYVMRPQTVAPLYDLFAVSNHYGSLGGGHYTAYAKLPSPPPGSNSAAQGAGVETPLGDRWYCFDDSHVSSVAPEAVRSPAAYVLFYRRRAEAAADPPDVGELLAQLREQRDKLEKELESAPTDGPAVPGTGAGPGDSGSDRQPEHDQDQDQACRGVFGVSRRGGALGAVGEVSIAAAAAAAQAARGDEEELEVEGRSMTAFSLGNRDPAAAGSYRYRRVDSSRGGAGGEDIKAECVGVGSPRSTPMSVGNTYRGTDGDANVDATANGGATELDAEPVQYAMYDPADFGAFHLDDGVGGSSLGVHGDGELLQPPGSPAEPELDLNNADLSGLYQEVEDLDVVRDRHSVFDMASSDGNDVDPDADNNLAGPGEVEDEV